MQAFGGARDAPLAQNRLEDEQQVQIERAQIHRVIRFVHLPLQSMHFLQPAARLIKRPTERPRRRRETLQPPVRVASRRRIMMSVRKSITLLTLLLSVSAAPFVAADVAGGFAAGAAVFPSLGQPSPTPKPWSTKATSLAREPASRILINSRTAPWPARRRRPSRVGA
jgi:hypothetical protein